MVRFDGPEIQAMKWRFIRQKYRRDMAELFDLYAPILDIPKELGKAATETAKKNPI